MLRKRAPLFRPNLESTTTSDQSNQPIQNQSTSIAFSREVSENEPVSQVQQQKQSKQHVNHNHEIIHETVSTTAAPPPLVIKTSVDKSKLIRDLLFTNPPLTKKQRKLRKAVAEREKHRPTFDSGSDDEEEEQTTSIAPQVRLAANGELVLDEQSLVIKRKNKLKDQEAIIEDSDDIIGSTSYASFRRKTTSSSRTKWLEQDTKKFYRALSICGTDFSLMESLIFKGARSRTELHKKFKREEKINRAKIDLALSSVISMSTSELGEVTSLISIF